MPPLGDLLDRFYLELIRVPLAAHTDLLGYHKLWLEGVYERLAGPERVRNEPIIMVGTITARAARIVSGIDRAVSVSRASPNDMLGSARVEPQSEGKDGMEYCSGILLGLDRVLVSSIYAREGSGRHCGSGTADAVASVVRRSEAGLDGHLRLCMSR